MFIPNKDLTVKDYEFKVTVRIQEGVITPEQVVNRLNDALAYAEGVGYPITIVELPEQLQLTYDSV